MRRERQGERPRLSWDAVEGAREYVLEFSLDAFGSVLFTTDGPMGGPAIRQNWFQIPPWMWRLAPVDYEIHWRVLARCEDGDREVARGSVPAEAPPEDAQQAG